MKIRTRLFLVILVLVGLGFYQFVNVIVKDLRPRSLATMEESMVETATLLASLVGSQIRDDNISTDDLEAMIRLASHWNMAARIYEMDKDRLDVRVYVTDVAGIVIYDSREQGAVGEDYSQWNDVYLTLRGKYGARSTRENPEDATTSILHVAAPIMNGEEILGVLTVAKPAASVEKFHQTAKEGIVRYGIIVGVLVVLAGMAVSIWITWPIEKLTAYANAIRDGKRPGPPQLGNSEIGRLAGSFEEMRDALEGKKYVEQYIESLTHEMKSPLSAIRGAAELLEEDMPNEQRQRFMGNILNETTRIQTLIDRLLELSSLESKKEMHRETVQLTKIIDTAMNSIAPQLERKELKLDVEIQKVSDIKGERFLLEQAIMNLLQNAIDFTPPGHQISLSLRETATLVVFRVHNTGSTIPDFAEDRLFERFYSLARPDTGLRSSGIGLTLVKEISELHGGYITMKNEHHGVTAEFALPI
jgi:two-component system sensor histidine kinase CreC